MALSRESIPISTRPTEKELAAVLLCDIAERPMPKRKESRPLWLILYMNLLMPSPTAFLKALLLISRPMRKMHIPPITSIEGRNGIVEVMKYPPMMLSFII
jgi:hypothetical protein